MWNLLLWAICLFLAVYVGRKGKGASCGLLHGAAFVELGAFLETLVDRPPVDPRRLLLYAAAAAIDVLVVFAAGAIWPKCKACGAHKFVARLTDDERVEYCAACGTSGDCADHLAGPGSHLYDPWRNAAPDALGGSGGDTVPLAYETLVASRARY